METNLTIKQIEDTFKFLNSDKRRSDMAIEEIGYEYNNRYEFLCEILDARQNMREWLKFIQKGIKREIAETDKQKLRYEFYQEKLEALPDFFATILYFSELINDWTHEYYNLTKFIEENVK